MLAHMDIDTFPGLGIFEDMMHKRVSEWEIVNHTPMNDMDGIEGGEPSVQ